MKTLITCTLAVVLAVSMLATSASAAGFAKQKSFKKGKVSTSQFQTQNYGGGYGYQGGYSQSYGGGYQGGHSNNYGKSYDNGYQSGWNGGYSQSYGGSYGYGY